MNTTELKALAEKAPKGRWDVGSYYIWRGDDRWHPVHVQKRGLMAETKTAAMSAWVAAANPAAILELIAQLEDARTQMERQKDEWLSWEAKRRDLEKAAAQLEDAQGEIRRLAQVEAEHAALLKAISDAKPVAWSGGIEWHPIKHYQSEQVQKLTRKEQKEYGFTIPLYTLNGIKK